MLISIPKEIVLKLCFNLMDNDSIQFKKDICSLSMVCNKLTYLADIFFIVCECINKHNEYVPKYDYFIIKCCGNVDVYLVMRNDLILSWMNLGNQKGFIKIANGTFIINKKVFKNNDINMKEYYNQSDMIKKHLKKYNIPTNNKVDIITNYVLPTIDCERLLL